MRAPNRIDLERAETRTFAGSQFLEAQPGFQPLNRGSWIHGLHQPPGTALKAARPRDRHDMIQRTFPQILQHQERDAAVVVAVQMTDDHVVESGRVESVALEGLEQARPRLQQHLRPIGLDYVSRLCAATAGKGVAGAEHGHLDWWVRRWRSARVHSVSPHANITKNRTQT